MICANNLSQMMLENCLRQWSVLAWGAKNGSEKSIRSAGIAMKAPPMSSCPVPGRFLPACSLSVEGASPNRLNNSRVNRRKLLRTSQITRDLMANKLQWIQDELQKLRDEGLYNRIRTLRSPQGAWLGG